MNVVKLLDPEYGNLLGKNLSIIHHHQIEIKMFNLLLALVLFNFVKCQQITGENEAKLAADLEIEAEMEGFFSSLDFQVLPSCQICLYAEIFTAFGAVTKFDALFLNVKVNSNNATSKIDDVLTEHGGLLHVLPLAVHPEFFLLDKWGDHSEPFLLFEVYCGTPPSCLKVMGGVGWWGGVVVAHEILVSAQGPFWVFGFGA